MAFPLPEEKRPLDYVGLGASSVGYVFAFWYIDRINTSCDRSGPQQRGTTTEHADRICKRTNSHRRYGENPVSHSIPIQKANSCKKGVTS